MESELKLRQNKIKYPVVVEKKTTPAIKNKQQKQEQNTFYKWGYLILLQSETCTMKIVSGARW